MAQDDFDLSGVVDLGGYWSLQRAVSRRLKGGWRYFWPIQFLVGLLILIVGLVAITEMTPTDPVHWRLLGFAAYVVVQTWANHKISRFAARQIKARQQRRGIVAEWPIAFKIASDGLHVESELASSVIRWEAITEIWSEKNEWILMIYTGMGAGIPKYLFESMTAERSFVARLLDRLSVDAQARSREARAFAN